MARRLINAATAAAVAALLGGCGMFEEGGWLGPEEAPPLPGERISVLELQRGLEPDPRVAGIAVSLPPPAAAPDWSQAGGRPNHVGGHPAFDWPAERVWSTGIGEGSGGIPRLLSSPIVAGGRVFAFDAAGSVSAIDLASGRRLWRVRMASPEEDSVVLGGGVAYANNLLFVTTGFGEVLAVDPENGGMVWRTEVSAPVRAAPTVEGGRVFVVGIDNQLTALDARTGEVLWTHAGIIEDAGLLGGASPAAEAGVVIAPYSSGEIFALRAETGRQLWSDSLAAIRRVGALASLADIRGLPVIDRDIVVATSHSGRTAGIDLRTGARIWEQDIGGIHTPWVAGDFVFMLTNDAELVALTRNGGGIRWVTPLPRWRNPENRTGPISWAGPVLAGGQLVVVGSTGEALLIDPATGNSSGSFDLRGASSLAPVVADGMLFVLSDDGTLTAYR